MLAIVGFLGSSQIQECLISGDDETVAAPRLMSPLPVVSAACVKVGSMIATLGTDGI